MLPNSTDGYTYFDSEGGKQIAAPAPPAEDNYTYFNAEEGEPMPSPYSITPSPQLNQNLDSLISSHDTWNSFLKSFEPRPSHSYVSPQMAVENKQFVDTYAQPDQTAGQDLSAGLGAQGARTVEAWAKGGLIPQIIHGLLTQPEKLAPATIYEGALQVLLPGYAVLRTSKPFKPVFTPQEAEVLPLSTRLAIDIGILAVDAPVYAAGAVMLPGVGAFALHGALRKIMTDAYQRGDITTSRELYNRVFGAAWEGLKGAIVQKFMGFAGKMGSEVGGAIAGKVGAKVLGVGLEVPSMVIMQSLLDDPHRSINKEDFRGAAIIIGGLHIAGVLTTPPGKQALVNIYDTYNKTGLTPEEQINQTKENPALRDAYTKTDFNKEGMPEVLRAHIKSEAPIDWTLHDAATKPSAGVADFDIGRLMGSTNRKVFGDFVPDGKDPDALFSFTDSNRSGKQILADIEKNNYDMVKTERQWAMERDTQRAAPLKETVIEPPAPGMVRLYRGELDLGPNEARDPNQVTFWSPVPAVAREEYATHPTLPGKVYFIDIPESQVESLRVSKMLKSEDAWQGGKNEFVLPQRYFEKAKLYEEVKPPEVYDLTPTAKIVEAIMSKEIVPVDPASTIADKFNLDTAITDTRSGGEKLAATEADVAAALNQEVFNKELHAGLDMVAPFRDMAHPMVANGRQFIHDVFMGTKDALKRHFPTMYSPRVPEISLFDRNFADLMNRDPKVALVGYPLEMGHRDWKGLSVQRQNEIKKIARDSGIDKKELQRPVLALLDDMFPNGEILTPEARRTAEKQLTSQQLEAVNLVRDTVYNTGSELLHRTFSIDIKDLRAVTDGEWAALKTRYEKRSGGKIESLDPTNPYKELKEYLKEETGFDLDKNYFPHTGFENSNMNQIRAVIQGKVGSATLTEKENALLQRLHLQFEDAKNTWDKPPVSLLDYFDQWIIEHGKLERTVPAPEFRSNPLKGRGETPATGFSGDVMDVVGQYINTVMRMIHYDSVVKEASSTALNMTPGRRDAVQRLIETGYGKPSSITQQVDETLRGVDTVIRTLSGGKVSLPPRMLDLVTSEMKKWEGRKEVFGNISSALKHALSNWANIAADIGPGHVTSAMKDMALMIGAKALPEGVVPGGLKEAQTRVRQEQAFLEKTGGIQTTIPYDTFVDPNVYKGLFEKYRIIMDKVDKVGFYAYTLGDIRDRVITGMAARAKFQADSTKALGDLSQRRQDVVASIYAGMKDRPNSEIKTLEDAYVVHMTSKDNPRVDAMHQPATFKNPIGGIVLQFNRMRVGNMELLLDQFHALAEGKPKGVAYAALIMASPYVLSYLSQKVEDSTGYPVGVDLTKYFGYKRIWGNWGPWTTEIPQNVWKAVNGDPRAQDALKLQKNYPGFRQIDKLEQAYQYYKDGAPDAWRRFGRALGWDYPHAQEKVELRDFHSETAKQKSAAKYEAGQQLQKGNQQAAIESIRGGGFQNPKQTYANVEHKELFKNYPLMYAHQQNPDDFVRYLNNLADKDPNGYVRVFTKLKKERAAFQAKYPSVSIEPPPQPPQGVE